MDFTIARKTMNGSIAIRLDPKRLENPDLDILYSLPDLIEKSTNGKIRDDGFDYAGDYDDTLIIYLSTQDAASCVEEVISILKENKVCDNWLLDTADIGISMNQEIFDLVHPCTGKQFTARPW